MDNPPKENKGESKDIKKISKDMNDLRKGLNEIFSAIRENSPQSNQPYEFKEYLASDLERVVYYLKKLARKNPFNESYLSIEEMVFLIQRIEYLTEVLNSKSR